MPLSDSDRRADDETEPVPDAVTDVVDVTDSVAVVDWDIEGDADTERVAHEVAEPQALVDAVGDGLRIAVTDGDLHDVGVTDGVRDTDGLPLEEKLFIGEPDADTHVDAVAVRFTVADTDAQPVDEGHVETVGDLEAVIDGDPDVDREREGDADVDVVREPLLDVVGDREVLAQAVADSVCAKLRDALVLVDKLPVTDAVREVDTDTVPLVESAEDGDMDAHAVVETDIFGDAVPLREIVELGVLDGDKEEDSEAENVLVAVTVTESDDVTEGVWEKRAVRDGDQLDEPVNDAEKQEDDDASAEKLAFEAVGHADEDADSEPEREAVKDDDGETDRVRVGEFVPDPQRDKDGEPENVEE